MMRNRDDTDAAADDTYRIEISKERALDWISPRIARFQSPSAREATADQVLNYLVERTGLLREPATDLIDFPHRTFQEFLAACAAGAESQEAMLAKQTDDDQWHETIMLAAGTSTGGVGFGRRLIEKLISRGEKHQSSKERSQRIRKTCFALALGCLENLRQQDEELRESVLSHLAELVPPRSDDDSRILSVAGDAAVGYLSYADWRDENTATVAACARALRLIGTAEALKALERGYVADVRQPVVSEVCKLSAFRYADIPLVADTVSRTGKLPPFVDVTDISLLTNLEGLNELHFDGSDVRNAELLSRIEKVKKISIAGVNQLSDYLFALPSELEELRIVGPALPPGDWASRLNKLQDISLLGVEGVDIERVLEARRNIESLNIVASNLSDISFINRLDHIRKLLLSDMRKLTSVSTLGSNDTINELTVEECPLVDPINLDIGFSTLERLVISRPHPHFMFTGKLNAGARLVDLALRGVHGLDNLSPFASLEGLRQLSIYDCGGIRHLNEIERFEDLLDLDLAHLKILEPILLPSSSLQRFGATAVTSLNTAALLNRLNFAEEIDIERCINVDSIEFIRSCDRLSSLSLGMLPRLSDLSPISGKKELTSLSIVDCDGIDSVIDLNNLELEELSLVSLDNVSDFESLASLQKLKRLDIVACGGLRDLSFALEIPELEQVNLFAHEGTVHIPEALMPKLNRTHGVRPMYYRDRRTWRYDNSWIYYDYRSRSNLRRISRNRRVYYA